jgi:hypothetical protein
VVLIGEPAAEGIRVRAGTDKRTRAGAEVADGLLVLGLVTRRRLRPQGRPDALVHHLVRLARHAPMIAAGAELRSSAGSGEAARSLFSAEVPFDRRVASSLQL